MIIHYYINKNLNYYFDYIFVYFKKCFYFIDNYVLSFINFHTLVNFLIKFFIKDIKTHLWLTNLQYIFT
jgi:hypothetical protein